MNIGQITISYKPIVGGAEVYIENLNKILREDGHKLHIYQPDTGIKDPQLLVSPNPNQPVGLQKMVPRLMRYNLSLFSHQLRNLRREDLLIIHYPEHYPPVFWHKKTVVLTHGVNWDFDSGTKKWQRVALANLAFRAAWRFVANDTNFLRAMGIEIAPKKKMFQQVEKNRWFIPNCVDTDLFKRTKGINDIKSLQAIVVPRNLSKARGVDLAIDAFELFAEKFPKTHLVVVGSSVPVPDSVEYGEQLLKKVAESPLKDRIVFLGSRPWKDMVNIYSSALLTLIPTRGNEGTSLSALESMACGTPTITTSVAGLKDLPSVQVSPQAGEISRAMEETMSGLDKMGEDQQKQVRKDYNMENWKNAWLEVIRI